MEKSKLCVGIVGAGAISGIYLQNLTTQFDELTVKAIADVNPDAAAAKAAEYGIAAVSVEELLQDPEIVMVVNLTPAFAHYGVIRSALEHGKHVYTEKTLTDKLEGSADLLSLAREKGLYLGSAPDTFLGAALQTARAAIDAGLLGEINSFAASANRCNDILLPLFGILRRPGCGLVLDYTVYYVTALVSLLGPVARVGSVVRAPYQTHINRMPQSPLFGQVMDTPNESQVSAILQMESGVTGTLHLDADSVLEDQAYFAIYGTKGILYLTDPNQFGGTVRFLPRTFGSPSKPIPLWSPAKYGDNARGVGPADMARAILHGGTFRPTAELAYHVHEVLDAMLKSGASGGFLDITSTCPQPTPMPQRELPIAGISSGDPGIRAIPSVQRLCGDTSVLGELLHGMDPEPISLAAIPVQNEANMLLFYTRGLQLKHTGRITFGNLAAALEKAGAPAEQVTPCKIFADKPWIDRMEVAPHQYIDLVYPMEALRQAQQAPADPPASQTICLKVPGLQHAWDALRENGLTPDCPISQDRDGTAMFHLTDPDGNQVQFRQNRG